MIAKYKGRGKGPRTKKQVKELRAKKEWEMQRDKFMFRNITKGTHI